MKPALDTAIDTLTATGVVVRTFENRSRPYREAVPNWVTQIFQPMGNGELALKLWETSLTEWGAAKRHAEWVRANDGANMQQYPRGERCLLCFMPSEIEGAELQCLEFLVTECSIIPEAAWGMITGDTAAIPESAYRRIRGAHWPIELDVQLDGAGNDIPGSWVAS